MSDTVINYDVVVKELIESFWQVEHLKSFSEDEVKKIHDAYELAYEAHKPQTRKGGGPYITHPIAVARIIAEEFQLDANTIIAAFLHDVVEDTPYTIEDIRARFGNDVAFLVATVTKKEKSQYEMSKQLDNYKQMLESIQHDTRALLVKLADRLHNMRTLSSMRPDKQMKIAGETDYFYAPLANRLGLYQVKTEMENLSMQYRCPVEHADISREMEQYKRDNQERLSAWCAELKAHFEKYNINVDVYINFYSVYAAWKQMQKSGSDFKHIPHKYNVQIIFYNSMNKKEKDRCLQIYSALTDLCKELPGSIRNYVDSPKENGYEAFHVNVLAPNGSWQKVQIASERMFSNSKIGSVAERVAGANDWILKFKEMLRDVTSNNKGAFMDGVVANFYNDDIMVFTPKGKPIVLPKGSTAIDFAYAVHTEIGDHAQYAKINGALATIKSVLHRGDCVEIGKNSIISPKREWLEYTKTYKAKRNIGVAIKRQNVSPSGEVDLNLCQHCSPLPGEEVIGFKTDDNSKTVIHKRNCPEAIRLASQDGDKIVAVDFNEGDQLYLVTVNIKAIDRYHLLSELVNVVTNDLKLSIENLLTTTVDEIVDCTINFSIRSVQELNGVMAHIKAIDSVEEVRQVKEFHPVMVN